MQHLVVSYAAPGHVLRLRGALGPLQGEGVDGALTFTVKAAGSGGAVEVSYIVGGYLRNGPGAWALIVDQVLAEQAARLKR